MGKSNDNDINTGYGDEFWVRSWLPNETTWTPTLVKTCVGLNIQRLCFMFCWTMLCYFIVLFCLFFLKIIWSHLNSVFCQPCFARLKKKKSSKNKNTVSETLLESQPDRENEKEQPEWVQAQLSEDFSQANSSLIFFTVCEFQELSDRHPDTLIQSTLSQRKCQVHRHFKPALVLWLEINNTAWY